MSLPTRPSQALRSTQVGRGDALHESRCRRCGVSCQVAVPVGDRTVVVPGMHCEFLTEPAPGLFECSVYDDRFAAAPWCHHADVAGPLGYLAQDCPYGTPDRGKVRVEPSELNRLWPLIWRSIRSWGVPSFLHHGDFLAMLEARQGRAYRLEPMYPIAVPEPDEPLRHSGQPTDPRMVQLRVLPADAA